MSCVFCGRAGSSEEDVFAKWIAEAVSGEGPFNLRRIHGRDKSNLRYFGVTSRAACRRCNNEWMSVSEQSVKPLLIPPIQDQPATWASVSDRTIVARWALKTALMLDRSSRPEKWTAPDKDFRYLFEHQEPPSSVTILLARYVPGAGETFFAAWGGSSWTASETLPSGDKIEGYRTAFSVGHAIFQVYGQVGRDLEGYIYERPITLGEKPVEDAFRRLWPLVPEPHEWPPRGAHFATSGLKLLHLDPEEDVPTNP